MHAQFPLWLEFSGLPQVCAEGARPGLGAAAWLLFRKIVELDCAENTTPGTVEITLTDLQSRTALDPKTLRQAVNRLRKVKLIKCYIPEADDEAALFQVLTPLPVARDRKDILHACPQLALDRKPWRYLDPEEPPDKSVTPELQRVMDLYMNTCGFHLNIFTIDRLRTMSERYPLDLLERTFRGAAANGVRSLDAIQRDLIRYTKRQQEQEASSHAV